MKYLHLYFALFTNQMYFVIVQGALAPDISLKGRLLTNNDSEVIELNCSTNIAVQLCTVEFLRDKRTHDNIRYYNNNCYHKMLICSPKVCMCSDDCMTFKLNVTVTQDKMNHSYSCVTRIEKEGVVYFANVTVTHDDYGGFHLFEKIVVPDRSVNFTHKVTTFSPEISTVSIRSVFLDVAFAGLGFVLCILLITSSIACEKYFCNMKSDVEQKQNISTIEDLGKKAGFVKNPQPMPSTNDYVLPSTNDSRPLSFANDRMFKRTSQSQLCKCQRPKTFDQYSQRIFA